MFPVVQQPPHLLDREVGPRGRGGRGRREDLGEFALGGIDWVIVGGESGPHARPMHEAWVLPMRDHCRAESVPFFFKQWGGVHKSRTGRTLISTSSWHAKVAVLPGALTWWYITRVRHLPRVANAEARPSERAPRASRDDELGPSIARFIQHLELERRMSRHTVDAYRRDLLQLAGG
jgi:hypothetical protein